MEADKPAEFDESLDGIVGELPSTLRYDVALVQVDRFPGREVVWSTNVDRNRVIAGAIEMLSMQEKHKDGDTWNGDIVIRIHRPNSEPGPDAGECKADDPDSGHRRLRSVPGSGGHRGGPGLQRSTAELEGILEDARPTPYRSYDALIGDDPEGPWYG